MKKTNISQCVNNELMDAVMRYNPCDRILSAEEEKELLKEAQAYPKNKPCNKAAEKLASHFVYKVKALVADIEAQYQTDAFAEAMVTFFECIDKFDLDKDVRFMTYVVPQIRGTLQKTKHTVELVAVPENQLRLLKAFQKEAASEDFSSRDFFDEKKVSKKQEKEIVALAAASKGGRYIREDNDSDNAVSYINPMLGYDMEVMGGMLENALRKVLKGKADTFILRTGLGCGLQGMMEYNEIAERLGKSVTAVMKDFSRALEILQRPENKLLVRRMKEYHSLASLAA